MNTSQLNDNPINSWKSVTVAVCVRNGENTIAECIESILRLDYPSECLRILVINNGSTDQTPEILKKFPIDVVDEFRPGRGVARNRAIQESQSELLAFTDADCTVSPDWLRSLVPAFSDSNVAAVGGPILTPGEDILARYYREKNIVSNEEFFGDYPFSKPFLATANVIFRLNVLKLCGGFSEDFIVAEDADICWKIQQKGYRLVYLPKGSVNHHHRTSLTGLFKHAIDYGFDGVAVFLHHRFWFPSSRWIWFGLYYRWIRCVLVAPLALFRKDPFLRRLPLLDFLRYSGLILGRLKAALHFKTFLL